MNKTCIIILGPTAVGKTSLGIQLAQHFSTEIISADSRQCYKELNIGVAKPSSAQLQQVPHYFINSHSIAENVNAAAFETYALEKTRQIFNHHDVVVMVGGTGLYIKAFCGGIDPIPPTKPGIRENIIAAYQANGIGWLQEEVKRNDPVYYAAGEIKNPHRLMRALEVVLSTGQSIVSFQQKQQIKRDFDIIKIGLELPKDELYNRINTRVDIMMAEGLPDEVKSLQPYRELNALQTVGYKELFSHFNGGISMQEAIEAIKINTRHYAKRQMTWFKKDKSVTWCSPEYRDMSEKLEQIMPH
ncbi:MAG: tRNA (adenosine(37)-N6)-dimethylallyltransferase MiaA [Ferruginibacter sp.]